MKWSEGVLLVKSMSSNRLGRCDRRHSSMNYKRIEKKIFVINRLHIFCGVFGGAARADRIAIADGVSVNGDPAHR